VSSNVAITTVEDVNLVAFLVVKGYTLIPYIKSHKDGEARRVAWDVQGDADSEIKRFYANELIGVRDFARALKDVRSDMYNVKNIHQNQD